MRRLLTMPILLAAQEYRDTTLEPVTDPSRAVVVAASIRALNVDTGLLGGC
jgi:hypothetical protein